MPAVDNEKHIAMTIMVVDDSKMIRVTAEKLLLQAGYKVILAEDGFEALSKMVESRPDLIILDVVMPIMDGYQTCALIKNHKTFKNIPVIMLSSKDGLFDRSRGKLAGLDLYLTKPFDHESFINSINKTLARTSTSG